MHIQHQTRWSGVYWIHKIVVYLTLLDMVLVCFYATFLSELGFGLDYVLALLLLTYNLMLGHLLCRHGVLARNYSIYPLLIAMLVLFVASIRYFLLPLA